MRDFILTICILPKQLWDVLLLQEVFGSLGNVRVFRLLSGSSVTSHSPTYIPAYCWPNLSFTHSGMLLTFSGILKNYETNLIKSAVLYSRLNVSHWYEEQHLTLKREFQLYFFRQKFYLHPFAWMVDGQFEVFRFFVFRCCRHWTDGPGSVRGLLSFYSKLLLKEVREAFPDSKQSISIKDGARLELVQQRGYESTIK